jgi:hypothetical protein
MAVLGSKYQKTKRISFSLIDGLANKAISAGQAVCKIAEGFIGNYYPNPYSGQHQ